MRKITVPNKTLNNVPGIQPPISIKEFKGESSIDSHAIGENFATETMNLTSTKYPAFTVRDGYTNYGDSLFNRITGLGVWKDSQINVISNGLWYRGWNGTNWGGGSSGLSTTAEWSFTNFKGAFSDINLIGSNGVDPIKKSDGTTISNLQNAPAGGNYVDQHDNRLYCAVDNSVKFTALRKGEDWTTVNDAGEIVVETNNGEKINGLKAGAGHIIVFKPNSVHEIYGNSPYDYKKMDVSDDIGLVSNKCVVNMQGTVHWLHKNGIYQYNGGTRPDKSYAFAVQNYINRMNFSNRTKSCVGTNGKKLYVAIPLDSATDPDTVLEYDPQYSVWYVWKNMNPLYFANMQGNLYQGDTQGKVLKMGGSTTDNGTAIAWRWVSKPFGSGTFAQKLRWYKMWIVVDLPVGSTMNIYLSKQDTGNSDWVLVNSLSPSNSLQAARAIIPVSSLADSNFLRVKFEGIGPSTVYEFDRQQRELPIV